MGWRESLYVTDWEFWKYVECWQIYMASYDQHLEITTRLRQKAKETTSPIELVVEIERIERATAAVEQFFDASEIPQDHLRAVLGTARVYTLAWRAGMRGQELVQAARSFFLEERRRDRMDAEQKQRSGT